MHIFWLWDYGDAAQGEGMVHCVLGGNQTHEREGMTVSLNSGLVVGKIWPGRDSHVPGITSRYYLLQTKQTALPHALILSLWEEGCAKHVMFF